MIPQFLSEGIDHKHEELSSLNHYFGEKEAFWFAFMSFYTCWLLIPAFIGLGLTIY